MDPNPEIQFEMPPFIRKYKSGRLERILETLILPASTDPTTGVISKDVTINPTSGVSARLYLPSLKENKKLPILIYFHGGGFCIETPFSPTYHPYLNSLVSRSQILAVSVHYRRVPEHHLPVAYDDCWEALQWVASGAEGVGPEPWLAKHADFSRVFLAGDSAGANIAHHMAMRARADGLGFGIKGLALIHPYFWGKEAVAAESRAAEFRERIEAMWGLLCPDSDGVDDPWLNPIGERAPSLKGLGCERVMVSVAEKDVLRERGWVYCERLKEIGWGGEVEFFETEGEGHVFHLLNPTCEKALKEMERLVAFFKKQ